MSTSSNVRVTGALAPNGIVDVQVDSAGKLTITPDPTAGNPDPEGYVVSVTAPDDSGLEVDATDPTNPVVKFSATDVVKIAGAFGQRYVAGRGLLGDYSELRLMTAANLPAFTKTGAGVGARLTADADGALTVDGVAVVADDRIGVKDAAGGGAGAADKGIWVVIQPGDGSTPFILERAADFDEPTEVFNDYSVSVAEGSANGGKTFYTNSSFGNNLFDQGAAGIRPSFAVNVGSAQLDSGDLTFPGTGAGDGTVFPGTLLAAIPAAAGGSVIDVEARAALNALLAALAGLLLTP